MVACLMLVRRYIKTLLGRKRRFELWGKRDEWGSKAYALCRS